MSSQEPAFCTAFASDQNNDFDPFSAISSSNTQDSLENNQVSAEFTPTVESWIVNDDLFLKIESSSFDNDKNLPIFTTHFTDKLGDNVATNSKKYGTDCDRSLVFTCDQVEQNQTGLLQLISSKNLNAALNLTTSLITELNNKVGQSLENKLDFLQIWQTRIAILMKLKKFREAETEARYFEQFERPCFYRETSKSNGENTESDDKKIVVSIVPFTFRVLLAELDSNCKNHNNALDKLIDIETIISELESAGNDMSEEFQCISEARDRIFQNQGKPQLCENMDLVNKLRSGVEVRVGELKTPIDHGLMHMFNSDFGKAYDEFLKCLGDDRFDQGVVVSNTALALLYQGKLQQAIQLLESRLDVCVDSKIIKNLTQLLDIRCNDAQARKVAILDRISHQIGDSFETECFNFS